MSRPKISRKIFIVDRAYQYGFLFRLLCLVIFGALVFLAVFYFLSGDVLSISYRNYDLRLDDAPRVLMPEMLITIGIYLLLLGIMVSVITILVTHRIAGPVYRFQRVVESLRSGDLTINVKLRKKDSCTDLAEAFNRLAGEYAERIEAARTEVLRIETAAARLGDSSGTETAPGLTEIREALASLKDRLSFFKTG